MASEEKVPCKHAECTARTTFTGEQPLYSKSGRKKHHRKLNYHPCCDGDGKLCEQGQRIKKWVRTNRKPRQFSSPDEDIDSDLQCPHLDCLRILDSKEELTSHTNAKHQCSSECELCSKREERDAQSHKILLGKRTRVDLLIEKFLEPSTKRQRITSDNPKARGDGIVLFFPTNEDDVLYYTTRSEMMRRDLSNLNTLMGSFKGNHNTISNHINNTAMPSKSDDCVILDSNNHNSVKNNISTPSPRPNSA
mmetsp:Transcript_3855/g.6356  ORF Transcript_3855/g.6356 Transcript_3855/m.6356 type:complete len:250 (-) Transcript_3855:97-846(-)